ncbi:DinB family protein [Streptomyces sp. NPDC047014]|uniref:DinB family protein n=1 Tax=Streptomyces sp. NPDC047014 TaxID=3155736 RepID=UPI0034063D22
MTDDPREHPSKVAGDRASLTSFLDYQRATLAMKCQDLSAEQLRHTAVPTTGLTLLGLVRHMVGVERSWFRLVLSGEPVAPVWPGADGGRSGAWEVADADADEAFARWHEACEHSRTVTGSFASLDDTVEFDGEVISLRYVLTHMIEEYARHNGHADLLREAIDGRVGE